MRRSPFALAALLLTGCGYIGDPLPPLANVPRRITDLAAVQRGARVIVQFTVPATTTEDQPIPAPVKVDLRAGPAEPFDENQWAASARQIPPVAAKDQIARYEIPAAEWTGKDVVFGVRMIGGNHKQSGWSNFVVVSVLPPPATPTTVAATAVAEGIRLTWVSPGTEFRVFRKVEDAPYAMVATVQKPEWVDTQVDFGKPYTYTVQTITRRDTKVAESELSEPITLSPVDTFPPAAPAGLHASTAPNSVELNWEQNTEADLAAYRIYRALGGGSFEKLAETSTVPSYSDRAVEAGKTYRYSITAVDRSGNESPRSSPIEVVLP